MSAFNRFSIVLQRFQSFLISLNIKMNLICIKSQLLFKRHQSFCFSTLSLMLSKNDNNFKQNQQKSHKMSKYDKNSNQSPTEEVMAFDSRLSDTFGTLSGYEHRFKRLAAEDLPEDDDRYDVLEIKKGQKMSAKGYIRVLNEYINQKPIQMKKALELYNRMVSEDRIPPEKTLYTLLINGCAKVGFTEKAFQLFEEMLKYNLKPTQPSITALFNACSECPFPDYGLQKARYLRGWMETEGMNANTIHYNSMIKAFGKLGDYKTAIEIVNEMVSKGQTTTVETFSMLLMGCISNKQSGLYEAMKLMQRMFVHKIPLNIHTFNLFLRAVRDCGIGSEDNLNSIISNSSQKLIQEFDLKTKKSKNVYKNETKSELNDKRIENLSKSSHSLSEVSDQKSLITRTPNILRDNSLNKTNVIKIDFNSLTKPFNRFMLFGGIEGFIKMMAEYDVKPNINSLTLMTELIDFEEQTEKDILDLLQTFHIRADTDFYNILIKGVAFKRGIFGAKHIFALMIQRGLQPNIVTFGVLSLGCNNFPLAQQLLNDMKELNIRPNCQIMGALVSNACHIKDCFYANYLIDYMRDNDINPGSKTVEKLEVMKIEIQKMLSNIDWNKTQEVHQRFKNDKFRTHFIDFKQNYNQWIQSVSVVEEDHPWLQFQFQEIPNKKEMHSFVKFMKEKIAKRRGMDETVVDEYEEDELYND